MSEESRLITMEEYKRYLGIKKGEESDVFIPKYKQPYYSIDWCGEIIVTINSDRKQDKMALRLHNCFKTKGEAKRALKERMK